MRNLYEGRGCGNSHHTNGIYVHVKKIPSHVYYFSLSTKVGVNPNPTEICHAIIIIIDDNMLRPTHCATPAAQSNGLELIYARQVKGLKAVLGNL
jgi:hypothetical protein